MHRHSIETNNVANFRFCYPNCICSYRSLVLVVFPITPANQRRKAKIRMRVRRYRAANSIYKSVLPETTSGSDPPDGALGMAYKILTFYPDFEAQLSPKTGYTPEVHPLSKRCITFGLFMLKNVDFLQGSSHTPRAEDISQREVA